MPNTNGVTVMVEALCCDARGCTRRRFRNGVGSENGNVLRRVETAENMGQAVHVRPDHQVVLVNERVWHMDGWTGELEDLGPADPPARWFRSALSADGETLVLWGVQGS